MAHLAAAHHIQFDIAQAAPRIQKQVHVGGWSWAAGKEGQLLCLNPESPFCYDIVPSHLTCPDPDGPGTSPKGLPAKDAKRR